MSRPVRAVLRGDVPAVWLALPLGLVAVILLYPLTQVVHFSFTSRSSFLPGEWIGLDNFTTLFDDPLFWRSLRNNVLLLLSVPVSIGLGLVIAAILYRGIGWGRFYESMVFLPFLPAVASVGAIFIYLLAPTGPLNAALSGVGLSGITGAWLADPDLAIWSVLGVVTWKRIGFTTLLFTARLASIDRAHFEAASVDGATWPYAFRRVAIPQMWSVIRFAAVIGFIEVFSWTFAFVFILTRGGPDRSTFTLDFLIYDFQFAQQLVGLASAVAVFLLLASLLVAAYRLHLARREGL